jgi:nucleoside-diphosphate-sugar epimerase
VRVLVVGGTGFIGGPVVRRLVASGHDVAVFHRGKKARELPGGVERLVGDRTRMADHADRLRGWKPDVVIDFVAFTETDVRGLLDALRGVAQRLVVLSSLDVYRAYDRLMRVQHGPPEATPIREDAPLREIAFPRRRWASGPDDVMWDYDKIPVERAALSEPELPGTVLRLPAVYGPGDHRRHRVGEYVTRMDSGARTLDLDADLSGWRWTRGYVEDVADAIAVASVDRRASGRTYNVGEAAPLAEGEWVRAIARVAGYAGTVVERKREDLPADVARELDGRDFAQDLVLDTSRIRDELGWRPRVPLDEALAATVAWEQGT